MSKIDLTGQKFGRLLVLHEVGKDNGGKITWKCQCECEYKNIIIARTSNLRSGNTQSCGCLQKEHTKKSHITHGQSKNPIYISWNQMMQRCYNSNNPDYSYYGNRGIKVCKRWHKFKNFLEDMKNEYEQGLTLERINNNKNYKPSNCKWATHQEQMHNKRAKGYYWHEQTQKWKAQITINHNKLHLGYFNTEKKAQQAYLKAKKKYHGKYYE